MGLAFPVPTEACFAALAWTGVEGSFAAGFRAQQTSDVQVSSLDPATLAITLLTEGVHYSVILAGDGTVTVLPIALPAAPKTILILRNTPAVQATDFANLGTYAPAIHTALHSAAALRDAEDKFQRTRMLRLPLGDTAAPDLPSASARASKLLGFDALGAPIATALATGPASAIAFTPTGGISANNVQAALAEVDAEKAAIANLASIAFSGAGTDLVDGLGAWVPGLTFATPGNLAVTYSTQVGSYLKHGRLVLLQFNINLSAFTWTTSAGALQITGVPFAPNATAGVVFRGTLQFSGITKAGYTQAVCSLSSALPTLMQLNMNGSGVAASQVIAADVPSGGTPALIGTLYYFT